MLTSEKNFRFVQNSRELLRRAVFNRIFDRFRRKGLNLFVRTNDIISRSPILYGDHEPQISAFFDWASDAGYCDFFIDIGGNIGLSCCPVGNRFKRIFVFEPNPIAFKILEVNVAISNDESKYSLFNYGIGSKDERLYLMIPKHNLGGAYIVSDDNTYSEDVLAKKDGFSSVDPEHYIRTDVEVRKGSAVFSELFNSLLTQTSAPKGVIKIDVEGFESTVIEELAKSIPSDISAIVVFENWDHNFDLDRVRGSFNGRASAYKLKRQSPFPKRMPQLAKIAFFPIATILGRGNYAYTLEALGQSPIGEDILGDFVLDLGN